MPSPLGPRLLLAGSSRPTRPLSLATSPTPTTLLTLTSSVRHASGARPEAPTSASKRRALRRQMDEWLQGPGSAFKTSPMRGPNYLTMYDMNGNPLKADASGGAGGGGGETGASQSDLRPFPLNSAFVSQSVLSEELRNEIHRCVKVQGMNLRAVSVMYGIDTRRVAAVVRLVDLEHKMKRDQKPLAIPYARAVHQMIPVTPLPKDTTTPVLHESINDLPIHPLTNPQIFWPVSESRQFTRVDAGRVFSAAPEAPNDATTNTPHNSPAAIDAAMARSTSAIEQVGKPPATPAAARRVHRRRWVIPGPQPVLQPADVRLPHPYLVGYHHERAQQNASNLTEINRALEERLAMIDGRERKRKKQAQADREKKVTRVSDERGRYEFCFRDVQATRETVGMDGRGVTAPGERYGVPSSERKRGHVKIPKKVD